MRLEGMSGDLVVLPHDRGWKGRTSLIARLYKPGTQQELLHQLVDARIVVRKAVLVTGDEQVPRGRKDVDYFAQTWLCSVTPVDPRAWAKLAAARLRSPTGFDEEDDDVGEDAAGPH
jgi:hypothetical protein